MRHLMRDVMVELTRRSERGLPPPTYRELGEATGCRPEKAWRAVRHLEADGWIKTRAARSRDGAMINRRTQRGIQIVIPWFNLDEVRREKENESR